MTLRDFRREFPELVGHSEFEINRAIALARANYPCTSLSGLYLAAHLLTLGDASGEIKSSSAGTLSAAFSTVSVDGSHRANLASTVYGRIHLMLEERDKKVRERLGSYLA